MIGHRNPARDLLDLACDVLDGTADVPAAQRTRAAAQLARLALEETVRDWCAKLCADLPRSSMRSRLIVLHVLADSDVSVPARAAWEGLSRACHRHAYELAPADAEIIALLDHVNALARAEQLGTSGS